MSNKSKKKKLDPSKLPSQVRKKLQKEKKGIFPILPTKIDPEKIKREKLEITLKCYRCKRNRFSKLCMICKQPICGSCETRKPKGYCVPCRNKHFINLIPILE